VVADAVETRVLGCLIEKQRTTPDVYPLSMNALRLACNQATNRDPVVEYDEPTIRAALDRLHQKGWARLASGPGSRVAKFRHLLDEALTLSQREIALLCVLMLRGPQTPGELKQRAERLYPFSDLEEIEQVLAGLGERELAVQLPRRPGQKEQRYAQLIGGDDQPAESQSFDGDTPTVAAEGEDRLAAVERELRELRDEVAALRARLAAERDVGEPAAPA
jgi:uncharacterized protein YceH (UPF0502 family)